MRTIIIAVDVRSQQNAESVLALYDLMITQRKAGEAVKKYLIPGYIPPYLHLQKR